MTQTQIPRRVLLRKKKEQAGDTLRRDIRNLQQAYAELSRLVKTESLCEVPPLAEITTKWAKDLINSRTDAVFASPVLTGEQKQDALAQWQKVGRKLTPLAARIESAVCGYGSERFTYDEQANNYVFPGIEDYLNTTCTVDVPQAASEHWLLINIVKDAVEGLRKWENEHDVKMISLFPLVRYTTAEELAEQWAEGSIIIDHRLDTSQLIDARNAKKKFEL